MTNTTNQPYDKNTIRVDGVSDKVRNDANALPLDIMAIARAMDMVRFAQSGASTDRAWWCDPVVNDPINEGVKAGYLLRPSTTQVEWTEIGCQTLHAAYDKARAANHGEDRKLVEYVVYSPNESATSDGAGFWSNEDGWVEFDQATKFSESETTKALTLPMSTGQDARWVKADEAGLAYSQQGKVAEDASAIRASYLAKHPEGSVEREVRQFVLEKFDQHGLGEHPTLLKFLTLADGDLDSSENYSAYKKAKNAAYGFLGKVRKNTLDNAGSSM